MPSGTVTWIDSSTGYGFISPTGGGKDLFVHPADIISGSKTLVMGATVEFGLGVGIKGGIISTNIVLGEPEAGSPLDG
jgi:CspA family cold shock protein